MLGRSATDLALPKTILFSVAPTTGYAQEGGQRVRHKGLRGPTLRNPGMSSAGRAKNAAYTQACRRMPKNVQ
jgi:hypothetical protein